MEAFVIATICLLIFTGVVLFIEPKLFWRYRRKGDSSYSKEKAGCIIWIIIIAALFAIFLFLTGLSDVIGGQAIVGDVQGGGNG